MNIMMDMLHLDDLAWPWMLLVIPLPLLVRALMRAREGVEPALRVPWNERLKRIASPGDGISRTHHFPWFAFLAWCLLCMAASRPQQLGPAVAPPQMGRDMMLAVDLSASMGEVDMELGGRIVDRLTAAKAVLADFLDRRIGDRIGLVVFGDRAFALTPLTLDRDSVRQQLQDSVVGLAGRATALGDAIGLATKRLQKPGANRPARLEQHVLIVLTDGVNTAGELEPAKAAQIARDANVRIHAIAFGGAGGGALSMFGFKLPMRGDEVDEAGLRRIAELTGGRFFRARDASELAGIYGEIDRIEPVARQGESVRPIVERYPRPLAAALVAALLALLLRRRSQ